jgi:hypothetical protein
MRLSPPITAAVALSLLAPAAQAQAQAPPRGPLKIHVVAVAPPPRDKAQVEAQRKRADELDKAFEARLKELRKAHGKDVKKWPEDVRLAFHKQLLERNQAFADPAYADTSAKSRGCSSRAGAWSAGGTSPTASRRSSTAWPGRTTTRSSPRAEGDPGLFLRAPRDHDDLHPPVPGPSLLGVVRGDRARRAVPCDLDRGVLHFLGGAQVIPNRLGAAL